MKGYWTITVLTEIQHFVCEKENWKGFAKVFQKRNICELVFEEPCASWRWWYCLGANRTTGLCSCNTISGVIFPLFILVIGINVSHSR